MAQFTLTIPDAVLTRVLDAIATNSGWTAGTGQTKGQWAADRLEDWVQGQVVQHEVKLAEAEAQAAAEAQVIVTVT